MNILAKLMPAKITITADSIRAEIARAESEIDTLNSKLATQISGIALLDDAAHQKTEIEISMTRRAIARLDSRLSHLHAELPLLIEAEASASQAAADATLRQRAEAARKASTKESEALLREYDAYAEKIADVLSRLREINTERDRVNEALRFNPIAEYVPSYASVHRKHPDREASEQRELRFVYVYADGSVDPATLDSNGNPKQPEPKWHYHEQKLITGTIEKREIVVARTSFRAGTYEVGLEQITLPPGFAGGKAHWPRLT